MSIQIKAMNQATRVVPMPQRSDAHIYAAVKLQQNMRNALSKKLKEAKDLLELEIMSEDEYNSLKEELTPIIRGSL